MIQPKTASGVIGSPVTSSSATSGDSISKSPPTATLKASKSGVKQPCLPTSKDRIGIHKPAGLSINAGNKQSSVVNVGRIIRRRRRWTSQELTLFELGLSIYDRDYDKIASLIKTRSTRQVRRHANYHLHKIRQQDVGQTGSEGDDSMVVYSDDEDRQRAGEFGHYDEALYGLDLVDCIPRGLDHRNKDKKRTDMVSTSTDQCTICIFRERLTRQDVFRVRKVLSC